MRSRAFCPRSSVTSRPMVSYPASTLSCAIPAPIAPRPTTPIVRISGTFTTRDAIRVPERRTRSAHVATPARYLVDARVRACEVRERPNEHEESDEEIPEHDLIIAYRR